MNTRRLTKLPEALLEISYPDDNYNNVHECNVGNDRKDVKNNLLCQLQLFHVNRVQARLGTTAGGKEEGIDCFQVAEACQNEEC
jgi:hypothetical protein